MSEFVGGAFVEILPQLAKGFEQKVAADVEGPLSKAGKAVGKSFALALAAGGAVVGGLAAIGTKSARTFAEVGGEVKLLQRYTAGTAEDMSKLRFAAKETGVDTDALGRSLGILSKHLAANDKASKSLGVSWTDAKGKARPLYDVLGDVSDRFAKMPDGIEKNALALQVFGKSGIAMLPFLNKGKAGLAELGDQAEKFGLVLSQKNLDAIKQNTLAHRAWDAALQGLQVQIGAYVLPILTRFIELATGHLQPVIATVARLTRDYLAPAFSFTFDLIGRVVEAGSRVFDRFRAVIADRVVPVVKDTLVPIFQNTLLPAVKQVADFMSGHLGAVSIAAFAGIASQLSPVVDLLSGLQSVMAAALSPVGLFVIAIAALAAGFLYLYRHSKAFHDFVQNNLLPIFGRILAGARVVGDAIRLIWDGIARGKDPATLAELTPFARTFDGLGQKIATTFQGIKSAVLGFVDDNSATFERWGAKLASIWSTVVDTLKVAGDAIVVIVNVFVGIVTDLWDRFGSHLFEHLKVAFDAVLQVLGGALDIIRGVLNVFVGIFTGDWSRAWDGVKGIFEGIWNVIVGVLRTALNVVSTVIGAGMAVISEIWGRLWRGLQGIVEAAWRGVSTAVSDAIGAVGRVLSGAGSIIAKAASGMWDGIKDAFRAVINFIIRAWNSLHFKTPKVHIPGTDVDFGGQSIGVPQIPLLDTGGTVVSGGLAMIDRAHELVTLPSGATVEPLSGAGAGFSGTVDVTLEVDGEVLARKTVRPMLGQQENVRLEHA